MYASETERRKREKAWRFRNRKGGETACQDDAGNWVLCVGPGFALTETEVARTDLESAGRPTTLYATRHTHVPAPEAPDWLMEPDN